MVYMDYVRFGDIRVTGTGVEYRGHILLKMLLASRTRLVSQTQPCSHIQGRGCSAIPSKYSMVPILNHIIPVNPKPLTS